MTERHARNKDNGSGAESRVSATDGRLSWEQSDGGRPPANEGGWAGTSEPLAELQELQTRIHRSLMDRLNLSSLSERDEAEAEEEVRRIVWRLLTADDTPLNRREQELVVDRILDEVFGLGPLEPLVRDPDISDILVNTYDDVWIEVNGKLERTDVSFRDDRHLLQVIDRIVSAVGRRIDDSSPMVDARLADGSRVNAVIPPLAIDGPHVSIRKFRKDVLSADDLMRNGTVNAQMLEFLHACIRARLNVLITGGTGAGKTTLLNVLSESIPASERIVTIEDSAELQLRQPHVVRLETRPPNIEGIGAINQRQLVINSLRMRPDRIIVGEVRGAEAVDMLQAMNTGHDGSLTTLHANSPRDGLTRLETMIYMANLNLPEKGMRQQISAAIDLIVHVARLSDGGRKITQISEVVGMEGSIITMQDIFTFKQRGIDVDGEVMGRFQASGIRPSCAERLQAQGIDLAETLFTDLDGGAAEVAGGWR